MDEVDGKLWADSHGFHYFETSAATGDGVVEMFNVRNELHLGSKGFFHIEQYYIQLQRSHTKAQERLKNHGSFTRHRSSV